MESQQQPSQPLRRVNLEFVNPVFGCLGLVCFGLNQQSALRSARPGHLHCILEAKLILFAFSLILLDIFLDTWSLH